MIEAKKYCDAALSEEHGSVSPPALFLFAFAILFQRQIQFLAVLLAHMILPGRNGLGTFRAQIIVTLTPLLAAKDWIGEGAADSEGSDGSLGDGGTGQFGNGGVDSGHWSGRFSVG